MVKIELIVILLSTFILATETAVTVTIESDLIVQNAVECGKNDLITCVVDPFPGTGGLMGWDTDTKPLTQCFPGSVDNCSPSTRDNYEFTSKPDEGTFNLTFNPVKFSDGSVEFRCTDTILTDKVTPLVKVLPQNSTTTISETSSKMEVTTSCVYPVSEVTFEWYYYKDGEPDSAKRYPDIANQTVDSTGCTTGNCGGAGVQKITSKLIPEDTEGEDYKFYVVVKHGAAPANDASYVVAKTFTETFKVKAPTTAAPGPGAGLSTGATVGIVITVVAVIGGGSVGGFLLYKKNSRGNR